MPIKSNNKILLVDDDHDILELISYNLLSAGFNVRTTDDPLKAVDTAVKYQPDLIVLDVMMPEINGLELCRQLRSIESFRDVIILFLSAKSDHSTKAEAFESGANGYLEKVSELRLLINRISTALGVFRPNGGII